MRRPGPSLTARLAPSQSLAAGNRQRASPAQKHDDGFLKFSRHGAIDPFSTSINAYSGLDQQEKSFYALRNDSLVLQAEKNVLGR
jgi:hypothetical protein